MTVFKPGDVVVLKSGGVVMTVDTVNTDIFDDNRITGVLCAWFVGNKLERARFDCNAIAPAQQQEGSSEKTELRPPETAGEYKAVMDNMMAAINDSAEASDEVSPAPLRKPKRASSAKDAAGAFTPVRSGMN